MRNTGKGDDEEIRKLYRDLSSPVTILGLFPDPQAALADAMGKAGGTPYLDAGEKWPICESCASALEFIFQFPDEVSGGLVQFFRCAACRPMEAGENGYLLRSISPAETSQSAISAPSGSSIIPSRFRSLANTSLLDLRAGLPEEFQRRGDLLMEANRKYGEQRLTEILANLDRENLRAEGLEADRFRSRKGGSPLLMNSEAVFVWDEEIPARGWRHFISLIDDPSVGFDPTGYPLIVVQDADRPGNLSWKGNGD